MKRTWLIGGLAALLLAACNSRSDLVGTSGGAPNLTAADTSESAALCCVRLRELSQTSSRPTENSKKWSTFRT